jgi:transposase
MSYSAEFRQQVLAGCDSGEGTRAVALRFSVSESWVRRIKQERRESGKVAPCTTRNRIPTWMAQADRIEAAIADKPDLTLEELQAELKTELSLSTLCRALRQLKLTFKKKC